jgi:LysR family transcriptional regulator, carnitine catabolism transcriptional activator
MMEKQRFDVSLEDLQTFLAIADANSFTRVAAQLNLSQPSISNRIRRLEEKLGVQLFERTSRRVEMTIDGRRLYDQTAVTLQTLKRVLQDFHGDATARRRRVDVAATLLVASVALPGLLWNFQDSQPTISVRVHDTLPQGAFEAVRNGSCDLALVVPEGDAHGLDLEPLTTDQCVVVTPRNHPLLAFDQVTFAQALAYPLLSMDAHQGLQRAILAAAAERDLHVSLAPQGRDSSTVLMILALVAAGFGIAFHPRSLIPLEFAPMIGTVPLGDVAFSRPFHIVTSTSRPLSHSASALRDHLRTAMPPSRDGWPIVDRLSKPPAA